MTASGRDSRRIVPDGMAPSARQGLMNAGLHRRVWPPYWRAWLWRAAGTRVWWLVVMPEMANGQRPEENRIPWVGGDLAGMAGMEAA